MCSCGSGKSNSGFQWISPSGQKITFSTEPEAQQAVASKGGTYKRL